ncbi:MAG TPA: DUF502 domain-containing protein [Deltaproteobacteria bacterium]|nr:DUF502 domain-containing protein [Deltaproteobacteria bacterium]
MKTGLRKYFITGLLIVVPLYITVYVFTVMVRFIDSATDNLPVPLRPSTYLPYDIPGAGILFTVLGIFIVGVLATNLIGRKLVELGEWFLSKIPFLRAVYKGTKQFMETFFSTDHDGFRRVVLLEYPRKGLFSIGFVTGKTGGELGERIGERTINIFIPTTPNPTSGYYIVVREKDVVPLEMTVEDAFKVVMTGGIVIPQAVPAGAAQTPPAVGDGGPPAASAPPGVRAAGGGDGLQGGGGETTSAGRAGPE